MQQDIFSANFRLDQYVVSVLASLTAGMALMGLQTFLLFLESMRLKPLACYGSVLTVSLDSALPPADAKHIFSPFFSTEVGSVEKKQTVLSCEDCVRNHGLVHLERVYQMFIACDNVGFP